jgi:hypothetical protein
MKQDVSDYLYEAGKTDSRWGAQQEGPQSWRIGDHGHQAGSILYLDSGTGGEVTSS